jgi:hypothetical protein
MPELPTHKQEFGSRHRDGLRCCQTHAFLPARTLAAKQLIGAIKLKTTLIYPHQTKKSFDQIKSPLDTIGY